MAAVAAGCGSSSKKATTVTAGPAVPWTAKRPSLLAARAPVPTACRAADLRVAGQVKFVARLHGGIALVVLRNTGHRTCRLVGRPRVRFVKQRGPVQVQRPIPPVPSNFPEVTLPASSLVALRPGEKAALTVTWDNWCQEKIRGKPHLPPSALRVTLPGGRGHVDADYNAVAPCLDPSKPSVIGVSSFEPSLIEPGRPWATAALRASIPGQPLHARRGAILHYTVELRNLDRAPVRFDRCPAHIAQLAPSGRPDVRELNCAAAHPIPPHGSESFAMELRVPRNAPLGVNGLFWALDPLGARSPQLNARVLVDK